MRTLRLAAVVLALLPSVHALCQTTIEECVSSACRNYPQIKEYDLIEAAMDYDISNAALSWVPQFSISGKATWQSDVVEMPFDIPGFTFDIPHDQYGVTGDITQPLWDGGVSASRRRLAVAGAEVKKKQLDVSLYSIRLRVQNIYLGIILIDKQLEINSVLRDNLSRSLGEVSSRIENGIAFASDADQVRVSLLACEQQRTALESDRKSYVKMLSLLTGQNLEGVALEEPRIESRSSAIIDPERIARPELALYSAQKEQIDQQRRQLMTAVSPKFNLTLQGGYGRPGLNMLSGKFAPYFVAGIRMQWNFAPLYTLKNDRHKADSEAARVDVARESFLLNTSVEAEQKRNEIAKAEDVLERDEQIISLRRSIRRTGETQYREGVIKMNDYLNMVDEEYKAELNRSLHAVQLMMAVYDLKNTLGE
ncbi:MAG: TolC family protein [Candidatus Cryptobacteroides sp.]